MFFGEFGDKHKDEVTLIDIEAKDFARFLIAISPIPPGINGMVLLWGRNHIHAA